VTRRADESGASAIVRLRVPGVRVGRVAAAL
jgi:hypothetical protein